jgi:hypothetical protein
MRLTSYLMKDHKGVAKIVTTATYDAPHKLQGTPMKPHRPRRVWDQLRSSTFGRTRPVFGGRV